MVAGRGELHLSILVETMRREQFEFQVSRPEPVTKVIDGKIQNPMKFLTLAPMTNMSGLLRSIYQGDWRNYEICAMTKMATFTSSIRFPLEA
ncbi:MAG: hypothetical protein Ct9H300mP11_30440 [Chloroflexota bacterium]|nr:MAG: hypothetical protein Ct9H300mP11_30440 [Chloroflexota bacterium]